MSNTEGYEDYDKIKGEAKNVISKAFQTISKSSSNKQLVVGSISGWTTGYITMKIGRSAAFALGGGIILLQFAQHKGYITIDWNKVKESTLEASEKVDNLVSANKEYKWLEEIKKFVFANTCFASGFIGGFLIGMAS